MKLLNFIVLVSIIWLSVIAVFMTSLIVVNGGQFCFDMNAYREMYVEISFIWFAFCVIVYWLLKE